MQSFFHDKGQQGYTLPGILLPIQVNLEVDGIEVDDGSIGVHHEFSPRFRYMGPAASRKYRHQLLQRLEWLCAKFKLVFHIANVDEVGGEGGVVVGEVPFP